MADSGAKTHDFLRGHTRPLGSSGKAWTKRSPHIQQSAFYVLSIILMWHLLICLGIFEVLFCLAMGCTGNAP